MKKLLLLLAIALPISLFAQVYKFKTIETGVSYINAAKNYDAPAWEKNNFLVLVNLDKSKLKMYAKITSDIDLVKVSSKFEDSVQNDWIIFAGVDQKGVDCEVQMIFLKDKSSDHVASLFLKYPGVMLSYRLKKDE